MSLNAQVSFYIMSRPFIIHVQRARLCCSLRLKRQFLRLVVVEPPRRRSASSFLLIFDGSVVLDLVQCWDQNVLSMTKPPYMFNNLKLGPANASFGFGAKWLPCATRVLCRWLTSQG